MKNFYNWFWKNSPVMWVPMGQYFLAYWVVCPLIVAAGACLTGLVLTGSTIWTWLAAGIFALAMCVFFATDHVAMNKIGVENE